MAFVVALVTALVATPAAIAVAHRTEVLDHPGPLKPQGRPVAYLGGLAVGLAWAAGSLVDGDQLRWYLPAGLALGLGLLDDLRDLPPLVRVGGEVVIGLTAGWAEPATGGAWGWVVTAVFVVGLLNAVNLLDGIDGLAAGMVAVAALGFAAIDGTPTAVAVALAGALLGFLVFNRPPARVYLGDAGAYLLGTGLALLAAATVAADGAMARWAALPLLVLVPVTDTAVAIARRALAGAPQFQGDRSHTYDQLVDRGWPVVRVTGMLVVLQAVAAAGAAGLARLPAGGAVAVLAAVAVAVAGAVWQGGFLRPSGEDHGQNAGR